MKMQQVSAMDILKPPIVRIGNRCYRINPIGAKSVEEYEEEEMDNSALAADEAYYDEVCDAFANNIEKTDAGFRADLDIPNAYFKFIIGKKGETKKRLENETRTQIRIPGRGQDGEIVINGRDRGSVMSAKTRIDLLVSSARDRQPFTHFLSMPINTQPIRDKFLEFKDDVLRFCEGDRGVDDTIFQNPHKLHLTIGTMPLLSEAEIKKATNLLQQLKEDLIDGIVRGHSLLCGLRGLEYMNDDPGEVDVLYAKVQLHDGSDRLQHIADRLVERFALAGLMNKEYNHVKLHVTVMNSLMRKEQTGTPMLPPGEQRGHNRERESFDANNILKLYGDYDFGPYDINLIHLSRRYSTGHDGYYGCEMKLDL